MKYMHPRAWSMILTILLLPFMVSCASQKVIPPVVSSSPMKPEKVGAVVDLSKDKLSLNLKDRLAFPIEQDIAPVVADQPLYSLRVNDVAIDKVLRMFADTYQLNIISDKNITGKISVDFHNLSFKQSMEAILGSLDYAWERDGALIRVHNWQTKNFTVDYIRLVRSSTGSSQASASSGGSTDSGGINISQQDTVKFWDDLAGQLKTLVSKKGTLVVNRMAGIIHVTDHPSHMRQIGMFLTHLNHSIHRQVRIDVKVVEVTLNDDYRLGIDWSRLNVGSLANSIKITTSNAVTTPAGGLALLPKALGLNIGHVSNNGKGDINTIISALSEQGNVQIISQPKVRTLNNQPAMIKVGVDKTFFRKEQSTTTGTATTTASTDVPQVVTEGIVLAITPQISADGWIMMDISPSITRVSSVTTTVDAKNVVQSSAPNLDIRQASSLVRAKDGSTIVLGGLIQNTVSKTDRGIPLLKDLPVLGNFFKGVANITKKTELVIFITPHLVDKQLPEYTSSLQ